MSERLLNANLVEDATVYAALKRSFGRVHADIGRLLEQNPAAASYKDVHSSSTPLHIAAWGGNLAAASLLLSYGAATDAVDMHSRTPLHWAAHCGHHDIAALLLNNKASIDVCDRNGMTPLQAAAAEQRYRVWALLQCPDAAAISTKPCSKPLGLIVRCCVAFVHFDSSFWQKWLGASHAQFAGITRISDGAGPVAVLE